MVLSAVALMGTGQDPSGEPPAMRPGVDGRGRDPWVFRAIFEDRTRMVMITPSPEWWMAFNPETGAMHKVWRGSMDFRGKVWDFSQDNSRATGRVYFASPSTLWQLPDDGKLPEGWAAQGVAFANGGWSFSPNAFLTSPPVDGSGWHRVFVAFDETNRKGRFRVTVGNGEDSPQWFESATSVGSDTDWQWNFKRIEQPSKGMVVKVESPVAKRLRALRVYGDRPSWFDSNGRELAVQWDGYEVVGKTKAVILRVRLKFPNGRIVTVSHRPEVIPNGWTEMWQVSGLPKGESIQLRREGLSSAVRIESDATWGKGHFLFTRNGEYRASFNLPAGER